MDSMTWRHVCFMLLAVVATHYIVQNGLRSGQNTEAASRSEEAGFRLNHKPRPQPVDTDVCREHYPDLYYGLERAIALWKAANRTISNKDVGNSSRRGATVTILIQSNDIRVLHTKGVVGNKEYRARAIAVLGLIERVLWAATAANEHLPTIEAAIAVGDEIQTDGGSSLDDGSVWTFVVDIYNKRHKQHWLIPDYGLYSTLATGSFEVMRKVAQEADSLFVNKVPKLGVESADDFEMTQVRDLIEESSMAMDEVCQYAFTIDRGSYDQSMSLLSLLNCNSLLLRTPSNWTTHLHHLLVPHGQRQNYVPIMDDSVDLEQNMKYHLAHPEKVQHIIQNAVDTFRSKYTSATATSCYIRRLINAYSTVSSTPEVRWLSAESTLGVVRGISFVDFILLDNDYDGANIHVRADTNGHRNRSPPKAVHHAIAAE